MFSRSITYFSVALYLSVVAGATGLAQNPNLMALNSDRGDMRDVYSEGVTAKAVLQENKATAAASAQACSSKSKHATLEHWYGTARVSKRLTDETSACLRARYRTSATYSDLGSGVTLCAKLSGNGRLP